MTLNFQNLTRINTPLPPGGDVRQVLRVRRRHEADAQGPGRDAAPQQQGDPPPQHEHGGGADREGGEGEFFIYIFNQYSC